MSRFRFRGALWADKGKGLWDRIFSRPRTRSRKRGFDQRNCRFLRIDSLESRCLLSVSPGDLTAVLANQTFGGSQVTTTAQSISSDDSGDFVVTWTRTANVLDANGNPVINPATGIAYQATNVYARYFTQTVEEIDLPGPGSVNNNGQYLPNGIATDFDNNADTIGHFTLTYNDETIDQIAVTAGIAPELSAGAFGVTGVPQAAQLISGEFTLYFNATGNDTIGQNDLGVDGQPDQSDLLHVSYDETTPSLAAAEIQTWLRGFAPVAANPAAGFAGSDATHATVNAIDPHTFVVDFGAATNGLDQSTLLQYLSPTTSPLGTFSLTGFLPAVQVTNLDHPFTVNNVPVSQTDPNLTAEGIQNYFESAAAPYVSGQAPFDFPGYDRIGPTTTEAPYTAPVYSEVAGVSTATGLPMPMTGVNPTISVVPAINPDGTLSYTRFDVTFTSVTGDQSHAPMVVTNCTDENGVGIGTNSTELVDNTVTLPVGSTAAEVKILKQSGNEFQVNPAQTSSVYTLGNQPLSSDQPSVAMSNSGNFEIAWRGQVSQEFGPKNVTDVYYRMYEPVGVTDSYSPGTYVPGTVISDLVTPGEATADPAEYLAQSFTSVRLLPNPTVAEVQRISFDASISGQFYLQLGSVLTGAISFDTVDLTNTAKNIQNALISAGFPGVTVTVVPPSVQPPTPATFTFDVKFGGASTGVDEPPIQYLPAAGATPVAFTQTNRTTDPYTVTVNANYTNPQYNPSVAVDLYGNFAVVWANQGVDASYFNDISLQRYDKLGNTIGSQVTVNFEDTYIDFAPDIAIGQDGNMVVVWSETANPSYLLNEPFQSAVYARGFSPQAVPLWTQVDVPGSGAYGTVSMDGQDNFTVAWDISGRDQDISGEPNLGVYAAEYQMEDYTTHQPLAAPAIVRNTFRLNSASADTTTQTIWPFDQSFPAVQTDLNGDIATTYQGYGPSASGSELDIPGSFFTDLIPNNPNLPNGDLLPYFNPYPHRVNGFTVAADTLGLGTFSELYQQNWNVDSSIDQVLFNAEYPATIGSTVTPATQEQLGRLRAVLEAVAGMLRGDSNGVLMTEWAANPPNPKGATYSDNIVNTQRDGQDQRYYLVVPQDVQNGSFQLRISVDPGTTTPTDIDPYLPPGYLTTGVIDMPDAVPNAPGGYINIGQSEQNIANAINATLGANWQLFGVPLSGSVAVREVSQTEIDDRNGTEWQVPQVVINDELPTVAIPAPYVAAFPHQAVIFELVFQGQAHDVPFTLSVVNVNDQQWLVNPATQQQTASYTQGGASPVTVEPGDYTGIQGSSQYNAALTMTSAGSMVAAYTNQALLTDELSTPTDAFGNPIYSNIYYEQLPESTDTAGPRVVAFTSANGVDLLPKLGNNNITATGADAQYLVLTFDEPMLSGNPLTDLDSVYNAANYQIYDSSGDLLSNDITHIDYGLSEVAQMAGTDGNGMNPIPDNKWEVILTINNGTTPLPNGTYTFDVLNAVPASSTTAGQPGLRDIYGTPLNLTGYNPMGANFQTTVTLTSSTNQGQVPAPPGLTTTDSPINAVRGGQQIDPAVSTANNLNINNPAANGNYVVVWTSIVNGATNIVGELFQANGTQLGGEFTANTSASTSWGNPAVAMNAAGGFVITWSGAGPNANPQTDPSDIFARRYNAQAQPIGNEFQVDQYTATVLNQSGVQSQPSIGMAPDGTFVIAWTSTPISVSNMNTANAAIYAREYSGNGAPISEFQVSNTSPNRRSLSAVAMDAKDDFVIVWEGDFQSSSTWGVYGDYFTASAATTPPTTWTQTGELLLNNSPESRGSFVGVGSLDLKDTGPRVGMDPAGNFDVTWANYSNSFNDYEVYAQQFAAGGSARAAAFMVSQTSETVNGTTIVPGWQLMPPIGVDANGDFTIAYTVYGQDNADVGNPTVQDYGIYTRMYNANGTPLAIAPTAFRVNATTLGNQLAPAVSSQDPANNSIIVWVGPDTAANGTTAIYLRDLDPPATGLSVPVTSNNPSISVTDSSVPSNGSAGQANFTVSLSAASTRPVSVSYTTANGTAKAGSNYIPVSGTLVFKPFQMSMSVSVNAFGLSTGGPSSETFLLDLKSPVNGSLGRSVGTATILDSFPVPKVIPVPVVTANPSSQTVSAGAPVSFTAAATGTTTPTVQWQVSTNGGASYTNIPAATSTTYTFTPTAAQSGSLYRAVFTNTAGSTTTKVATLTVNTGTAPVVTTNPSSQNVNAGQTVSFTAAASGTPSPTVQWQVSTNGGSSYTPISGATSITYTFTPTAAQSGSLYRAVFTNTAGTVATTAATLTINGPPVVTTNPSSQNVSAGQSVSFTAAASGAPPPTVQWQVSANGGSSYTLISGATSVNYTFTPTAAQSGSLYRAVFTNTAGTVATTAATLTVNTGTAPVVTTNPSSQIVSAGQSVSFTAAATGTPTPTVQWQVSTNGVTYNNISGATSPTYSFTATTAQSGDLYRAVFTNSAGTVTTTAATLTVNTGTAPVVTTNPNSPTVNAGMPVSFTAAATGTPMPTAQWQVSSDGGVTYTNIAGSSQTTIPPSLTVATGESITIAAGATSSTYTFSATAAESGYLYRVVFTSVDGSTMTTTPGRLTVNSAPVVTTGPTSQTVKAGQSVTFTAVATGRPAPSVQWQVMTSSGTSYVNILGATSTTYTFTASAAQSGNSYRAVFTNALGQTDTNPATLTINPSASVVMPSTESSSNPVFVKTIQASTVTGPEIVRLTGFMKSAGSTTSPSNSGLTVLHPEAVAIVLTERLG